MRITSFLLAVLSIAPVAVFGAAKDRVKFAKAAVGLTAQSRPPSPGSYYFKNVKTGEMIAYAQKQHQSIFLAKKGSPMTARRYGKYMKVTPTTSNDKCFSAQWNFQRGENWAAVLYACSKTNKHTVLKREQEHKEIEKRAKMGPVRPDKQLWVVKPGPRKGTYYIIATDHITNMSTKAMGPCTVKQVHNPKSRGICLQVFNPKNTGQLWSIHDKNGRAIKRDILSDDADIDELFEESDDVDQTLRESAFTDAEQYEEM